MQQSLQGPVLSLSPSFNSYSCNTFAEIAAKVGEEFSEQSKLYVSDKSMEKPPPLQSSEYQSKEVQEQEQIEGDNDDKDDEDEFEFSFCRDNDESPISADEIFFNGQIRPIFPIFNRDLLFSDGQDDDSKAPEVSSVRLPLRKLLIEERNPPSSSSSEADELDGIPPGTYCVWAPKSVQASPERCKKSNSTGSSKRWRFRDLLHRSNSDGKDTFVFLTPSNSNSSSSKAKKRDEKPENSKGRRNSTNLKVSGKTKGKGISGEAASAHEIHYVRNRALKEEDRRKSYLPYRQDLVGFFANVNVLSRTLQPF
ncbi:PREDICTED: uncharacterized protein LOC104587216 [Nelumbo nucifera]|uniref:Uncharacterized protein n=2 Tax=Nelumbo nucifera TaxID=4432 RepID=A0A822YA31_NELNU|nr:PREDICTED: uncharacterized protein LOC104587216 [Nelumbo nucifera]DAD30934.1 TPA_asm: hypothetical protein HUJ06_009785 [Nelumbo nucifera]